MTEFHPLTGEPSNAQRAEWAQAAVDTFAEDVFCGRDFDTLLEESPEKGDDAYCAIQDLISNLLHLAHINKWDTKELVERAVRMFEDELGMENPDG